MYSYGASHRIQNISIDETPTSFSRDVDWLRQNGLCLDHLKPGFLSNTDRGLAALATRSLPRGSVVAPLPLIPVDRRSMAMPTHADRERNSWQLLMNYCFGHANSSSLLLYPYSHVVNYLNHGGERANAALRWSAKADAADLLESFGMDADTLIRSRRHGLLLELVALRDIRPNEEVVIDYGADWQAAWDRHVESHQSSSSGSGEADDSSPYVSAAQLTQEANGQPIRTVSEQEVRPYPPNVETACYYDHEPGQLGATAEGAAPAALSWANLFGNRIPFSNWPCRITGRVTDEGDGKEVYTVEIELGADGSAVDAAGAVIESSSAGTVVVTDVPRQALFFIDKMYTQSTYLPSAFRAPMGLPPSAAFSPSWLDDSSPSSKA